MNNLSLKQRFAEGQRVRLVRAQSDVEVVSYGHKQRMDYPVGSEAVVADTMRDIVLLRDGPLIFWVNQKDLEVVCAE